MLRQLSWASMNQSRLQSLDDIPDVARRAERQKFLNRWYKPVAIAPFFVLLVLDEFFFPQSRSPLLLAVAFLTLGWGGAVAAYALFLLLSLRCPRCGARYGLGDKCKHCELPRHPNSGDQLVTL